MYCVHPRLLPEHQLQYHVVTLSLHPHTCVDRRSTSGQMCPPQPLASTPGYHSESPPRQLLHQEVSKGTSKTSKGNAAGHVRSRTSRRWRAGSGCRCARSLCEVTTATSLDSRRHIVAGAHRSILEGGQSVGAAGTEYCKYENVSC